MRRAYRRPVTDDDLQGPLEFYRKARAEGGFRRGHRDGAERGPGESASSCSASNAIPPASRRRPPIASAIWNWPPGCRSSCGAAFPTTSCSTLAERGELRQPEVLEQQVRRMLADARSRVAGHQLRRQWLLPAQPRVDHAGPAAVPRFRRQPAAGVPAGNGAVLREHPARGPQRARSARGRLHVPQRAAGEALRHSARVRQPLPPRRAGRRTASAAACCARAAS